MIWWLRAEGSSVVRERPERGRSRLGRACGFRGRWPIRRVHGAAEVL